MREMIRPASLQKGDKIAIISPATIVKEEYVRGAEAFLRKEGFDPVVYPGALGPSLGSYAASHEQRIEDLKRALADSEVHAILCARGGYGSVHILPEIPVEMVRDNPKWIIGFSDISALHALWQRAAVMSLHAPMAKHLTLEGETDFSTLSLLSLLRGEKRMDYEVNPHPFNRQGIGKGMLRGGNLAVLNGLASTPYDILTPGEDEDVILFIEDISEAIYAVERMLMRLILSGGLQRLKGLIIGQFTEYKPDRNHESMEVMVDSLLKRHKIEGLPVAFNFPTGHVKDNYPLVEGAEVILEVSPEAVRLGEVG